MPATLFFGFLLDYFTFTNIEIRTTLILLFIYFFIAGSTIFFIHLFDAEKISLRFRYIRLFAPLLIQFTFGALLGGTFIFYWFSGSIFASWPFILLLIFLMISNEVFRHYFVRPGLQISIYFFVTFSLLSVALPYIFNSLSSWLFIAAGCLALLWVYGFIRLLSKFRDYVRERKFGLYFSIFSIFTVLNFFYFYNLIPPVPLALREAGIHHNVSRSGGTYKLQSEKESFWDRILPGQTLHLRATDRAFAYTAIFAPAELRTTIIHDWQYYDNVSGQWTSVSRIPFAINGGRKEGYRGYSIKSNLTPGTWRVFVKTERGQVLGRLKFSVERVEILPELEETLR